LRIHTTTTFSFTVAATPSSSDSYSAAAVHN
jgi:hypothetical protein